MTYATIFEFIGCLFMLTLAMSVIAFTWLYIVMALRKSAKGTICAMADRRTMRQFGEWLKEQQK